MRLALQVVGSHTFLVLAVRLALLGLSAVTCGGLCGRVEFYGWGVFYVLISPGIWAGRWLVPYAIAQPASIRIAREAASWLATELALFTVVFVVVTLVMRLRRRDGALL